MARILRGEIRWANLNLTMGHEQAGLRPVIILSKDVFNERMGIVIAVALTTKQPKYDFPLTFELESSNLPKKSWALTGQIRTLSVERIGKKICDAGYEEVDHIIEGLNEIIGT